jgi:two-component system OmpR family sensor kinase
MSIRMRIALFGAAIVAGSLLVFGILISAAARNSTSTQQDSDLTHLADALTARLNAAPPALPSAPPIVPPIDVRANSDAFVAVVDRRGTVTTTTASLDGRPLAIPATVVARTAPQTLTVAPGVDVRLVARPLRDGGHLIVGRSEQALTGVLRGFSTFIVVSAVISLVVALAATWYAAGRALRPLDIMVQTTDEVGRTADLGRRLPPLPHHDQLSRLGDSVNVMLGRIQDSQLRLAASLEAQRRFVADASHELRSPLTTLRGNAGFLVKHPNAAISDRDAVARDIATETERMSRLVDDLLLLARADAGHHLELRPVDLGKLVEDVAGQVQRREGARKLVGSRVDVSVRGNDDALRQLVWILVDNAVRHTRDGGTLELRLNAADGVARLSVGDNGDGISPADIERVFTRFYQSDTSRFRGGAGLGLAIARWIVDEHGGRICAYSPGLGRGSVFVVELPVASATPRAVTV